MKKGSKYTSKPVSVNGTVNWTKSENKIWEDLVKEQLPQVRDYACREYLEGLQYLNFPEKEIPQLPDINSILAKMTGWKVEAVPALINFDRFFELLANRRFPAATFIRRRKEFYYLQEPDIFHELFGHCPLLTNKHFADFTARYGQIGLNATHKERIKLARLYWFTVEFGLLKQGDLWKVYGGGILSSVGETAYCETNQPEHHKFNILEALRTPYRIDIMQPIYFYMNSLEELEQLSEELIMENVHKAMELGLLPAKFPPKSA
ncbi:MAG: phenylalanine 4-monooxygenase [Lentisphaerales bacterium]|nr:phenylalanine 4-monooxygenase [Lentisphaerales bacterium]